MFKIFLPCRVESNGGKDFKSFELVLKSLEMILEQDLVKAECYPIGMILSLENDGLAELGQSLRGLETGDLFN